MRNLTTALFIATAGLCASACAGSNHEMALGRAAMILNETPKASRAQATETQGLISSQYGDKYTAAQLFEQSVNEQATVQNRFNLAVAYRNTGRYHDAAELFRGLETDGRWTWMTTVNPYGGRQIALRQFNVAEESARRLTAIEAEGAQKLDAEQTASLAGDALSDARAIERDRAARGGR